MIFNQISDERDSTQVLKRLAESLKGCPIQHVIFAGYDPHAEFGPGTGEALGTQDRDNELTNFFPSLPSYARSPSTF